MASSSEEPGQSSNEVARAAFDQTTTIIVGRVLAPHGLKGEVKVESLTDFPERFEPGSKLFAGEDRVRIERSRWQGRSVIVKFDGVDDRNQAEALRGLELQANPLEQRLGEDTYYRDDLIGLTVVDEAGAELGGLAEILATGSNDVYVVRGAKGELLLPATDDVIKAIDLEGRRVVVEVIEGLKWRQTGGAKSRPRPAHRATD